MFKASNESSNDKRQAILDEAQVKAAAHFADRDNIVEYCNACINSGLGALSSHYDDKQPMSDIAALTILGVWVETIERRIAARGGLEGTLQ